jgi:hypothetical protein
MKAKDSPRRFGFTIITYLPIELTEPNKNILQVQGEGGRDGKLSSQCSKS